MATLLNPNGLYFGPHSKLNIAGSFFASTAVLLDLGGGATFRADASEIPNLLTMRVPVGVQFDEKPGDIVTEGQLQTGQDLTLTGNRLMISGEVLAGQDLFLQGNRVLMREGDRPFIGSAGQNLEIEGRNAIEIDALEFSESGLSSGGNLVLRSLKPIRAEARFLAGQDFQVEGLDEQFGKLVSPYGQIILANSNVAMGDYTGGSLHVLAGGSVRIGSVQIKDSGSVEATINPNNQGKINNKLTYTDLALFEIPGFELKKNGNPSTR